jgi:hypothetical protein
MRKKLVKEILKGHLVGTYQKKKHMGRAQLILTIKDSNNRVYK